MEVVWRVVVSGGRMREVMGAFGGLMGEGDGGVSEVADGELSVVILAR